MNLVCRSNDPSPISAATKAEKAQGKTTKMATATRLCSTVSRVLTFDPSWPIRCRRKHKSCTRLQVRKAGKETKTRLADLPASKAGIWIDPQLQPRGARAYPIKRTTNIDMSICAIVTFACATKNAAVSARGKSPILLFRCRSRNAPMKLNETRISTRVS